MSRRVNECGYRVVVTGEGADELFGGYPAFKRDMLRFSENTGELRKQMEASNKLFRGAILSQGLASHPTWNEMCGFTPSWIQPWIQNLDVVRPLLHGDLREELKDYDPLEAIAGAIDWQALEGRHFLDKAQYTWIKTMLECQILNWGGDRVDMANSMESRPAFLDHLVAEAARDVPPHLRIRDGQEKWVLREAMKDILPEVLYKREKFAFMAPPGHTEDLKKNALKSLIQTYADESNVQKAGIFDPQRLADFFKGWEEDEHSVSLVRKDALLNHILGLQILHRQFIENGGSGWEG
jgi:asparagine synthase (glutamine-hydrolysing)